MKTWAIARLSAAERIPSLRHILAEIAPRGK